MKTIVRVKETPTGVRVKKRIDGEIKFEDIEFNNYFYIKKSDYELFRDTIQEESKHILGIAECPEKDAVKIIFIDNFSRYKLKSKFEILKIPLYEADLMANKRWLIDTKPEMNSKGLKWLMYDIETKDDSPFEKDMMGAIIAMEPVLCIAYKDIDGNQFFIKNENLENPIEGEKKLLKLHDEIITHYDIILGWNSKRFDDTYIKQRNELHEISNYNWDFINQIDYKELVEKYLFPKIPSYSLNNASKSILNDTKLEGFKAGKGNVLKHWRMSFDGDNTLEKYNEQDVELMFKMEQKLNFITLAMNQADIAGCQIQETLYNSEIWDMILLKEYDIKNLLSPTRPSKEEIEKRKKDFYVAGAYTFCLNPGVHEKVFVFDFKSFYPTTVTACNICNTTLLNGVDIIEAGEFKTTIPSDIHQVNLQTTKSPFLMDLKKNEVSNCETIKIIEMDKKSAKLQFNEKHFTNSKRGILSEIMDLYISKRDETKYLAKIEKDEFKKKELDSIQNSYKTLANSGYGAMGMVGFRYFNQNIANAITQFCRYVIKECICIASEMGFKVIQGDTDSIMFINVENKHTEKDLEYEFYKQFDEIAKRQNIESKKFELVNPKTKEKEEKNHFIVFEHEKTFNKMISIKKKNYADLMIEMDKDGNPIGEPKISITGLECIAKDTNPLAKEMQKTLIDNILNDTFSESIFLKDINMIKLELQNNVLDTKYLIMQKSLNKNPEDYGQPMIDSKTGLPKLRKSDGMPMFSPIPAHVKLAKELIKKGHDIYVGDEITYIVKEQGPIVPISIEDYIDGEDFDREYYWDRIITPIMKILFITHPNLILDNPELWTMKELNEKKLEKHIEKLKKNCLKDE